MIRSIQVGLVWLSLAMLVLIGVGGVVGAYAGWVHLHAAVLSSMLMLVAGLVVFVTLTFTNRANPAAVVIGYAISVSMRGLFGLGGGCVVVYALEWFPEPAIEFWLWLLSAYLVALAIETIVATSVESKAIRQTVISAHGVKG